MRMALIVLFFALMQGCMQKVPVIILEYPPRLFESMDSVHLEQRFTRHMSGRISHLHYIYEDSIGNEIKHGPSIDYYLDGLKKEVTYYRKGLLWGPSTTWYNDGHRQGLSYYQNGKLHGVSKTWDKEGLLTSIKYWKNGKLHGPQISYSHGQVVSQNWWQENRLLKQAPASTIDTVQTDTLVPILQVDTTPVPQPNHLPDAQPEYFPASP